MNHINFDQLGGFPLETETLLEMQKAYSIFNAYGELAGNKVIVKGCELVGNTVANGFIYLDGELLEFRGAQQQSEIIVVENVVSVEFETKEMKPTYYERYATFGSGLNAIAWSDFKRAFPLSSALFLNEVRMYTGLLADLPWGWHLADGQNGTNDLRDRFPIPYNPANPDYNTMLKTGGAKEVTLTEAQMPIHKHTGSTGSAGAHTHQYDRLNIASKGESKSDAYYRVHSALTKDTTDSAGAHTHSITLNNTGGGEAHENRPPFIALGFIQFTGQ